MKQEVKALMLKGLGYNATIRSACANDVEFKVVIDYLGGN